MRKKAQSDNIEIFKDYSPINNLVAKPFLKWAGGKSQLITQFKEYFPKELKNGEIENYYEPFLGGGAVFFFIKQNYNIKNVFLYDINEELILMYKVIQNDVDKLIQELSNLTEYFLGMDTNLRKGFFYNLRDKVNLELKAFDFYNYSPKWISRAADLIFLNKTCFNGLFRVNSKGEFNVPFGDYKNPPVFEAQNLLGISELLQNATIKCLDFSNALKDVKDNSFIYLDPPYRPISKTASFTSYSKFDFNEDKQKLLAECYKSLSKRKGVKLMLSNSDPKNENPLDDFFESNYAGDNIIINRVYASRMINCVGGKRGKITELLITNYDEI